MTTETTRDYYKTLAEFENGDEEWNPAEVVMDDGEPCVPRRCTHCDRPAYYDTADEWYHHAVDPAEGCFLIGPEPERDADPCHPLVATVV